MAESILKRGYAVRHVNFFPCATPGCKTKIAQSKFREVAIGHACAKCRRNAVDERQTAMFHEEQAAAPEDGTAGGENA